MLIVLVSCKKQTDSANTDIADAYVGNYSVKEDVLKLFTTTTYHYEFNAKIIKGDSTNFINAIQSSRNPYPVWVGPDSDTLKIRILPAFDSLHSIYPRGLVFGKILKPDTLKIHYDYGAAYIYDVKQTWVRIR